MLEEKESILVQIYSFYQKTKKNEPIITLAGSSMSPILKDGWKVRVRPVNAKEISYGDLVVFTQKKLICHRVLGKFRWNKKLYFIQSGDHKIIGNVFEERDLFGKVVEAFDANGNIIDYKLWHKSYNSLVKFRLLGYIYLPLFLTKRFLFGKRQNRFTHLIKRFFWYFYDKGYHSAPSGNIF